MSMNVLHINHLCFYVVAVAGLVAVKSSPKFSNATTYIPYTTFFYNSEGEQYF